MKKILLILVLTGLVHSSYAQQRQSYLDVTAGVVYSRLVDEGLGFNKLLFKGTNPKLSLQYGKEKEKRKFTVSFEASHGKVNNKGKQVSSELTNAQLSASFLRKLAAYKFLGKENDLFAGLKFNSMLTLMESADLNNDDIICVHGLYLNLIQTMRLNKSREIRFQVELPVVGFKKRLITDGGLNIPPYDEARRPVHFMLSDNKISNPGIFRFKIDYLKKLSPFTYFSAKYNFSYMISSGKTPLHLYDNQLLVGFKFCFKNDE